MTASAQRKTTQKKTTQRKASSAPRARKKAAAPSRPSATKKTATPTAAATPTVDAASNGHQKKTGPVLGAYRLSLTALEMVTVGVGGAALGSLSRLGLPKGAAKKLTSTHAGAIRGATKASDVVGTKAAKVVGKTVAVGASAAKYVFPE